MTHRDRLFFVTEAYWKYYASRGRFRAYMLNLLGQELSWYKYRSTNLYNPRDEIKKAGLDMTDLNQITLESQYEHVKKMEINNWENVRIPRPTD
ncbi:uncharacterized protein LOC116417089 isoform X3 [Nasonia vitripennis]|uniref:Cytochrome c oxidase assembly protein COX16 homolog, mitochondrial n=1 Tax=Nasonia vitripennis TaxID=7425 RepID=A0A7M7R403_NASVI|nr:uncharacterized protein LOC116417089 isoform X3 [Nasonia vitripennis]